MARQVGIFRSNRWLVRHVNLRESRGQLVYIIGANGAGKTTIARAMLGLIEITEGRIERQADLRFGYVPQRLRISPTLPLTMRRLLSKLTRRLEFDKSAIGALWICHQRFVVPNILHFAFLEKDDRVGQSNRRQSMGDNDDKTTLRGLS